MIRRFSSLSVARASPSLCGLSNSSASSLAGCCFAQSQCPMTSLRLSSASSSSSAGQDAKATASYAVVEASSSSSAIESRPSGRGGKWDDDPQLEEIDYSVPQVNCAFIADLIARRKAEQRKQWGELSAQRNKNKNKTTAKEEDRSSADKHAPKKSGGGEQSSEEKKAGNDDDDEFTLDDDINLALHPSDGILILDLRTVAEVSVWGTIEGSKILPMHEFYDAMHLDPASFYSQYGFDMPSKDTTIIFYCQHGPRSLMAAQIAHYLGYKNVLHLQQGYFQWCKQFYLLCRRWMVHDHTTGIDNHRLTEFAAARHIAHDIASEFNELVDAETELIRLDHSRSMGTRELPMPESIKQLAASFEAERDRVELEDAEREAQKKRIGGPASTSSLPHTSVGGESKGQPTASDATAIMQKEAEGKDPVLSTLSKEIDELEHDEARMRRDYTSEAAKVLRRQRAGERTGVPDSYMFRRRENPHGTGR